tara:strand:- start:381 stop:575 length:195 start_codon:yes stop_codon:yes gene_type:complete
MKDYTALFLDDTQLTISADSVELSSDGEAILYDDKGAIKALLTNYKYVVAGRTVFDEDESGESK